LADEDIDWSGVSDAMARQIVAQGETYLQAQLQAAIASDQRASTMASILATVAAAIIAGSIAYWDKAGDVPVLLAGLTGAVGLLTAAGFAAWAARPTDFFFPGNQPAHWWEWRKGDFIKMMGGEAENYQRHIEANDEILMHNQRAIWRGFKTAIGAPVAAVLVWGATELIGSFCQGWTA